MNLKKGFVIVDGTSLIKIDIIEYEGSHWMVPQWLDGYPSEGLSTPVRAIRIDFLPHSFDKQGCPVLRNPIPQEVLNGQITDPYEVLERPVNLAIPIESYRILH